MRGKACSTEFMRKFAALVDQKLNTRELCDLYCMKEREIKRLKAALRTQRAIEGGINTTLQYLQPTHFMQLATLPEEAQLEVAQLAEENQWTVAELKQEIYQRRDHASPPPPTGVYDVILADPPWRYNNVIEGVGAAEDHYGTLSLTEICAEVKDLQGKGLEIAGNAVLFLWVTNPFLQEGLQVAAAWGFDYKTNMVWVKTNLKKPGLGFYIRGHHELLFIATRGSMLPKQEGKAPVSSIIQADVRAHSQKPEITYDIIEGLYPGHHYCELYAREKRPGWASWGDELS